MHFVRFHKFTEDIQAIIITKFECIISSLDSLLKSFQLDLQVVHQDEHNFVKSVYRLSKKLSLSRHLLQVNHKFHPDPNTLNNRNVSCLDLDLCVQALEPCTGQIKSKTTLQSLKDWQVLNSICRSKHFNGCNIHYLW